jgi:UDP-glucose 4-epimerase
MNILVTGGAGYIGGTVATILHNAGHKVTVLDNLCHSMRSRPESTSSKPTSPTAPPSRDC